MGIEKENYGVTKEGKQVTKYTLTNGQGASVSFLDYGAVIQSIIVPDKDGKLEDVVLGYDTLSGYESNVPSFGSPVGRCANRISNACFVLNGKEYPLDDNDGTNCLHGGFLRYNYLMYDAECATSQDDASVSFSRVSPDGEQGFPGNLTLTITYTWNDANELMIEYNAVSDADTILNITNHSYFNIGCGGQLPEMCWVHRCRLLQQNIHRSMKNDCQQEKFVMLQEQQWILESFMTLVPESVKMMQMLRQYPDMITIIFYRAIRARSAMQLL